MTPEFAREATMAPSDRLVWPPQGSLRAYVDLSIAHWRVASYTRRAPEDHLEDEPEPDPPVNAVEPVEELDGSGGSRPS
ncbi:MAG TPA: hypothetical protein VE669_07585 [Actinomycetota bacterium]|jgi:hypothetical protein|nr:hypothetical protein [Actinomycetota bacterium]